MEFTWNDGLTDGLENEVVAGEESLIRRLLSLPNHPALLLLHCWTPVKPGHGGMRFSMSGEDKWGVLAQYYSGVSWVSWRNAVYHPLMALNVTGFRYSDMYCDWDHVNAVGHRWVGHHV